MQKVFIPQIVERIDRASGRRTSVFDFSPAARFGQLEVLLESSDNPLFIARLTPKLRKGLDAFKDGDYLLAVGDPSVIATCAAIIAQRHRKFRLLKWEKTTTSYIELEIAP